MEFNFEAAAVSFNKDAFINDLLQSGLTSTTLSSVASIPKRVHVGTDFEPDDAAAMNVLAKAGVRIESIVLLERPGEDGWDRAGRLNAFVAQNEAAYGGAHVRKSTVLDALNSLTEIVNQHTAGEHKDETLTLVWLANVLPVYDLLCRAKESTSVLGGSTTTKVDLFIYGSVNLRWAIKMLASRDGVTVEEARVRLMAALHQAPSSGYTVHLFESYPMFCDQGSKAVLSINDVDTPAIIAQLKENGASSDSAFLLQQMADWNKEMIAWQLKGITSKHAELVHITADNVGEHLELLHKVGHDEATPEGLARSIRLTHRIAKTPNQMVFADEALAIALVTGFAFTPVKASFSDDGFVQVSTFDSSDLTSEPLLWYSVRPTVFTGREMFEEFAAHYLHLLKQ